MKILVIVVSIILAAIVGVVFLVISFFDNILVEEWTIFKLKYGKQYESLYEEPMRMRIYAQNRILIARHNQRFLRGQESFEMEVNQFSDLQGEEFRRTMLGFRPIYNTSKGGNEKPLKWIPPKDTVQLPLNVDWRDRGAVTRVKNQGDCGSCWAFSATGALESQWFLQHRKLVELSEQNVLDCSGVIHACNGSTPFAAYEGIMEDEGINSERDYPYEAQQNDQCKFNPLAVAATVMGAKALPPDETVLMQAVASIGPISIVIRYKDSFQHYSSGVYYEAECSWGEPHADYHAMLVVGYGKTSDGVEYWLVKNAWGKDWGDSGYIKMARNRNNMCGIANMAIFPLVPVNGNITFPNKVSDKL